MRDVFEDFVLKVRGADDVDCYASNVDAGASETDGRSTLNDGQMDAFGRACDVEFEKLEGEDEASYSAT